MTFPVTPFSLKDAPALIERLLPVQKLSAEAYKEQMANVGKTLTALGSYWKGRKPLILAKACVIGCLLPATDDPGRDLEIFEKLMAMDDESFVARWKRRPKPKEILATLSIARITDYFIVMPEGILPVSSPIDWSKPEYNQVKIAWRADIDEITRRRLEAQQLPKVSYRERVDQALRPEEVMDTVHDHIWDEVNSHIGTQAHSFPELVDQLGIMRYGHRPLVGDTFCGSGQIPFEAARIGCDIFASDLNPVACMLTWSALNIVGGTTYSREKITRDEEEIEQQLYAEIDALGVETDGFGWRAKAFIYCLEVQCPQTGWMVPLLPTLHVSNDFRAVIRLHPNPVTKSYDLSIFQPASVEEYYAANKGTIRSDGRGQDPYLVHTVNGIEYHTKITTLRGDYRKNDGNRGNSLRLWEKNEFKPRTDDVFQERLYAIHWVRPNKVGKGFEQEFRSVTSDDLQRESIVDDFISDHLVEWQKKGYLPDMRIEPGTETTRLYRERGWTHWHHLFTPRQLLIGGFLNKLSSAYQKPSLCQVLNWSSRLSMWNFHSGGRTGVMQTFTNQALNPLYNYGARGLESLNRFFRGNYKSFPITSKTKIANLPADQTDIEADIFITDPPYGDAVNYDEILDFFIAWLRKNPSLEFSDWIWDSRRSLAIKGEDEGFRRGMVASYRRMTDLMPYNGIQVIMFTHQSGAIWADMANIVWASGLQVTAAWYVVTETDSALREGSYVKGTVLLVLRKRSGQQKTTRDDLAWEIQEEVEAQVQSLTGLNQEAKGLYRNENVFEDADIQMAGYAAALRVLTKYGVIDGRDMTTEAIRPRVKGETTFVDDLITFAVETANQSLVPQGIPKSYWDKLSGAERFYLKMLDMEVRGAKTLDNYQNFAKAFKVHDFKPFLASQKANDARLKSAVEFGHSEMNEGSELHDTVLRAVLYAIMELSTNVDGNEVLAHLVLNIPSYYGDMTQRELAMQLADYLAKRLTNLRPEESSNARILNELLKNQRLG